MAPKKQKKTRAKKEAAKPSARDADDEPTGDESLAGEDEDEEQDEDLSDEELVADVEASGESEGADRAPISVSKDSSRAITRVDALQQYMSEVQRHSLLTPEEEKELAVRYAETGDVEAAAKMVTSNLRLVVKIAYEYRRAYRNMMDLIQEGNIGLMQAIKRYDPYRGVKLSSYAAYWIRAYMLRFILNNWRLVKIGTTQAQRKLFFNLNKEKARLQAMGIEPTDAEIAKRLNVDEKDVVQMDRRLARNDASLDVPVGDSDGKQTTRLELLPGDGESPYDAAESKELGEIVREQLEEFRESLEGKELAIFDKRTVADEPLTLQQLGDEFGVSRERVRQLEARMIGRLRNFLRERLGDAVEVGG